MNIVLVEDDKLTSARLQRLIASCLPHAKLISFERLAQALAHAKTLTCDYWLVDLGLPDGSGIDLIRAVRTLQPDAHILVISMFGDVDHIVGSIQAGANGYLLKDAAQQDLIGAIEAIDLGGTPLSPMIASRLLETMAFARPQTPMAAQAPTKSALLTAKEVELLHLLSRGYAYTEAAVSLSVAPSTVQTYIKRIYSKLSVNSKSEAVFEAQALGILR